MEDGVNEVMTVATLLVTKTTKRKAPFDKVDNHANILLSKNQRQRAVALASSWLNDQWHVGIRVLTMAVGRSVEGG